MRTYLLRMNVIGFLLLYFSISGYSNIKLPTLISDGMVLQRDTKANIWGWATPGEKVTVKFIGKTYRTITDSEGKWKIILPATKAGGPYIMNISGSNTLTIKDILIGDVWFCSGQSNMVLPMERVKEKYPDEIANANYPEIRNFFVPTASDVTNIHDDLPPGKWVAATPKDVLGFGALTFFLLKVFIKYIKCQLGS